MARLSATRILRIIAAVGLVAVGLPLWRPLLLAAVLAGALSPLHERLTSAVKGRRSLSAALVTAAVVLFLLAPLAFVGAIVVKEARAALGFVTRTLDHRGLAGLTSNLPDWLGARLDATLARASRAQHDLGSELTNWPHVREALGAAAGVVGSTSHFLLMAALMLVVLFFLLRDGPALIAWAEDTRSFPPGRVRSLLAELRGVSKSVLGAQLGSGVAQAIVATIGYAIARVPSPVVFGVLSLAASFLPIGGVSIIGVALAGLLWFMGRHGWAMFLAAWTVLLTGLIDNVIRPLLVRGTTNLHAGLAFCTLLGGLLAFGPIGIVVGPLALALFLSVSALDRRDDVGVES